MDKIKEATAVIVGINQMLSGVIRDYDLIKIVCAYFDKIKSEEVTEADKRFLKYISNTVGVPQFYDMLEKFNQNTKIEYFDLTTLSAIIYESTLTLDQMEKVHKYQKQILGKFSRDKLNRYFLSASTSFGKTHIVFDIIRKMNYDNVVLIFPTIALLSENLERLTANEKYHDYLSNYSIHTLSETEYDVEGKNLFIYTPERYLSFVEKRDNQIRFDFAFIDEIYKMDNDYIIDEEVRENERDVAYRLAVFESLKPNVDALLAGPFIDFLKQGDPNYNGSFDRFLAEYNIELLDYNSYEIVNKSYGDIQSGRDHTIDEELRLIFSSSSTNSGKSSGISKTSRLIQTIQSVLTIKQNAIVYCYSTAKVEDYARKIITSGILDDHNSDSYDEFVTHVSENFNSKWTLIEALRKGIGIHHGLIPKYLQKEIVSLFNKNSLKVLISTTTITEGVNTSAKNLVVLHSKKGEKQLKKFDAKNIAGRAGRFMHHYSGRVLSLDKQFFIAMNSSAEGIKHKNYDLEAPKDEIDLFYTREEFLKPADRLRVQSINEKQREREIPDYVFSLYKVVSRLHKIEIYDQINKLSSSELRLIKALIRHINFRMRIDRDGFQVVLKVLEPIVLNHNLKHIIVTKDKNVKYSILTHLVQNYLEEGFMGSVRYKMDEKGIGVDQAIRETSKFVYNTLKYQVVKYLGVFNVMYKLSQSKKTGELFEEVSGIDRLLTKLEYNALTPSGRIASDYGVPSSIVDYYENIDNAEGIKAQFDAYEKGVFERVERIVKK